MMRDHQSPFKRLCTLGNSAGVEGGHSSFCIFTTVVGTALDSFRTDINGLRAWAVLLVILFHFQVPGFQSGFLGVDVFFVISGFLMASILYRGLAKSTLSLPAFYASRMKRIYPALIAVCAASLVLGWYLLMPRDYMALGAHVRESLLFSSNYRYLSEAGYFDAASESKWLLHTWSLSVEWQFYLLYPLLAMLLYRLTRHHRTLLVGTLLIAALSLAWDIHTIQVAPDRAFYGFPGRAWEMLLGAAAFHLAQLWRPERRVGLALHLGGLASIAVAACLVTPASWPGLWALLPTAGAAALILGNSHSPLTAGRFWNWCGERSYSIYLWHWPVVVLLHYFLIATNPLWVVAGLAASALLAELSYRLIEQPCRGRMARFSSWRTIGTVFTVAVLLAGLGQTVRRSGIPERLPDEVIHLADEARLSNPRQDECLDHDSECVYGSGPVGLILIGDSHADAVVNAMQSALEPRVGGILFKGESDCIPLPGLQGNEPDDRECEQLAAGIPDLLAQYPGLPVLVVSHWAAYANYGVVEPDREAHFFVPGGARHFSERWFQEFDNWYLTSLCRISQTHPLWIMRPTPVMPVDVASVMGREALVNRDIDLSLPRHQYDLDTAYIRDLQDQAARQCGIRILDPIATLCDEQHCVAETSNGLPIYRDDNHFTEYGNRLLIPMFQSMVLPGVTEDHVGAR